MSKQAAVRKRRPRLPKQPYIPLLLASFGGVVHYFMVVHIMDEYRRICDGALWPERIEQDDPDSPHVFCMKCIDYYVTDAMSGRGRLRHVY